MEDDIIQKKKRESNELKEKEKGLGKIYVGMCV